MFVTGPVHLTGQAVGVDADMLRPADPKRNS
jgi:hypothetical protein